MTRSDSELMTMNRFDNLAEVDLRLGQTWIDKSS